MKQWKVTISFVQHEPQSKLLPIQNPNFRRKSIINYEAIRAYVSDDGTTWKPNKIQVLLQLEFKFTQYYLRNVLKLNFTTISTDTQRKIEEVVIDPTDSAKFQKDIYEVCLQCKNICDAADGQRISQHHRRLATIFDKKRIRKYLLWIQLTGLHLVPAKMLISRVVERM